MNSPAAIEGTCIDCGKPVRWCRLTNGTYRSCELQPVPAACHNPRDVYAYRKSLGAWVDLGSVSNGPLTGLLAHFCQECRDGMRNVSTIADLLPEVIDDIAAGGLTRTRKPTHVVTTW